MPTQNASANDQPLPSAINSLLDAREGAGHNKSVMASQRAKIQTAITYLVLSIFSAGVAWYSQALSASADVTEPLTTIVRPIVVFMTVLSVFLLGVSVFLFMAAGREGKKFEK